ncbi:fatty acyl-CoA hydrolase precursor, medium chain-like [Physella acuta]|uniref:fatty acyl-CoA hydrolase precursor, medium chain-like n=1 Tax=Physella acuta TaxID=109671 RepID=UPI0027DDFCD0|nr:fatty acyl-CoA hydrolase precursor, medium chain-like [Physella acuta]
MLITGLAVFILTVSCVTAVVVDSPFGRVKGQEITAKNGKSFYSFQGIPFAKPPVGELRFAKPVAHPKIAGTLEALAMKPSCVQETYALLPGEEISEDCLYLNIYAKEIRPARQPSKVLVWIHGGGFLLGSYFMYNCESFVTNHDVIVVTISYRLGALGFLSTENEASKGNYGMWDQVLALRWVKDNIAAFGGDPNDVAIAGESAGGASVSLLSVSPAATGLFTKAFSTSGSATSLFTQYFNAQTEALKIAKQVNCWDGELDAKISLRQSEIIVECLRTRPAEELTKGVVYKLDRMPFVPRVDGEFLPQSPLKLVRDNRYLESLGFYERSYLVSFNNYEQSVIELILYFHDQTINARNVSIDEKARQKQELYQTLPGLAVRDRLEVEDVPQNLIDRIYGWYTRRYIGVKSLAALFTDLFFEIPTFEMLNVMSRKNSTNARLLYFNHFPQFVSGSIRGMPHVLDLVYWFDIPLEVIRSFVGIESQGNFTAEDHELKRVYSSIIADFVKTGNAERSILPSLPGGWPTYDPVESPYLDFNPHFSIQRNLAREKRLLWETLVPQWATGDRNIEHLEL